MALGVPTTAPSVPTSRVRECAEPQAEGEKV